MERRLREVRERPEPQRVVLSRRGHPAEIRGDRNAGDRTLVPDEEMQISSGEPFDTHDPVQAAGRRQGAGWVECNRSLTSGATRAELEPCIRDIVQALAWVAASVD